VWKYRSSKQYSCRLLLVLVVPLTERQAALQKVETLLYGQHRWGEKSNLVTVKKSLTTMEYRYGANCNGILGDVRFLLGDILWFGRRILSNSACIWFPFACRGLGHSTAFFYVDFKIMNTASGGVHVEQEGRSEVLLRAKVNIEGVNDFDPLV